jgi:hypothetical protein
VFNIGVEEKILPTTTDRAHALVVAEISNLTLESEDDVEDGVASRAK